MAKTPNKTATAVAPVITLAAVMAATFVEPHYLFVPLAQASEWEAAGLVEVNRDLIDPASGAVATRITETGKASLVTDTASTETAAATTAPAFAIEVFDGEIAKRSRAFVEKYPFSQLPAPGVTADGKPQRYSFFIPATADRPDPWKSLASTVSTAQARYRTEAGVETYTGKDKDGNEVEKTRKKYDYEREFALVRGTKAGVEGVYIARTK